MNETTWLSHGGPGSGRYPKGSGKTYLKKLNRYSRGYTRAHYHMIKNRDNATGYREWADSYRRSGNKRQYNKKSRAAINYRIESDRLAKVMKADQKTIDSIAKRLATSMDVPLKTVQRSTIVDARPIIMPPFFGAKVVTSKYTKYKVDKKKLKKG